jgi:hypothetical protein
MLTQLLKYQNYYALIKEADIKRENEKIAICRKTIGGELKGKHSNINCCNQ